MSESSEAPLLVERRDAALILTINRPEIRNAIDQATANAIAAAIDRLESDPELSVGVITGAGSGFCAGMDLKAFAATGIRPWGGDRGFAGIVRRPPAKPMIAAIEGFAVAGGFEIALACDLIVAAKGAKIGVPEVKRSLVAAGGALLRLSQRFPREIATEMILTGDLISADRAFELGAISRLSEPGSALEDALGLAATIGANGPLALVASKQIMDGKDDWPAAEFWDRQDEIVIPVFESDDAREGALAFAEKRPARWSGR